MSSDAIKISMKMLKAMTFGAYDLQMLRMQTGLRLCANFRAKLKVPEEADLDEEAERLITTIKASYKRLTDGLVVARNRELPARDKFVGDELISTYTELVLVSQYVELESRERKQFAQLEGVLEEIPVYTKYLRNVVGIGPAMSAVLITYFDIEKAHHISAFWAYAGLDVASDGFGRSRREEHLVDRAYTDKNGNPATRKSVTYNPWLKSRLLGAMATSFMRTPDCPWRASYDGYKHRIQTDPAREKATVDQWKARNKAKEPVKHLWTPGRIHRASLRYMTKMFLADFWVKWRTLEGLPVTPTYHEAKMGHRHVA